MNARERFIAVTRFEKPDYVPLLTCNSIDGPNPETVWTWQRDQGFPEWFGTPAVARDIGREYREVGPVVDSDSSVWLFGILPVSGSNTTREALDAAIRKRSADALIDITVENYVQFWILFVRYVTSVRGTTIQFK